ncbi:MAG: nuclear transport factor 2 family protein [Bacteroidota bacterium]
MKKYMLYSLIFLGFIVQSCSGQNKDITKDEVQNAVEALNEALVHPEMEKLKQITSKDLTYGHSSGTLENQSEFIDALLNGSFHFLSITTSQDRIALYGDTAVARHIMTAKGTNKGEGVDVHIGIMLVFKKEDGRTLLLARQAYKI